MTDEARREFLDAYDAHRVEDQQDFYSRRSKEYEKADNQAGAAIEILLFLAATCGVVAALWSEQALWLGVGAAALSATAAVIGSWAQLIGFAENAELYRAAQASLAHIRSDRPKNRTATEENVQVYLRNVEEILLGEVRSWGEQWGQPPDSPSSD